MRVAVRGRAPRRAARALLTEAAPVRVFSHGARFSLSLSLFSLSLSLSLFFSLSHACACARSLWQKAQAILAQQSGKAEKAEVYARQVSQLSGQLSLEKANLELMTAGAALLNPKP